MNTDNLILRETDNLPLINKDDTLTSAELDGNFIKIYNDFLALSTANDPTLIFDIDRSYSIGEYATYNGKMWVSTIEVTGVTPDIDSLEWLDIFPTVLAHEKNKDTYLDYGGANATSVAEIRAFIDAGLTSTTNLTLTTKTGTSFKIESSTGTDVILPQATVVDAGLLNAEDKVKLNNTSGINTGDQTLVSLNAEDVDNKVTDFTTINDTLYPTTQAVDTYITAQVPSLVETFLDSNVEVTTNKAIDFTTVNDTKYPTVKAVDDHINSKLAGLWDDRGSYDASTNLFPSTGGSGGSGAIMKGDIWTINVEGTLGGTLMHVGDTVRSLVDAPGQTSTNWALLENAIGYVPENVINKVTTFAGNTTSDTKYPSVKAIVDNFDATNIKSILGVTVLSGSNTGDQIISDSTLTTSDITTNDVSTIKHGFVPKAPNDITKFLRGDGTWGTPASGGGSGIWGIANSSGVYTYYATWPLAVAAAVSGQCIELFADITISGGTLTLKNGVNINGNGHTLTLNTGTHGFIDNSIAVNVIIDNIILSKTDAVDAGIINLTNSSSKVGGNATINVGNANPQGILGSGNVWGFRIIGNGYPILINGGNPTIENIYINTTFGGYAIQYQNTPIMQINNCLVKSTGNGVKTLGDINNTNIVVSGIGILIAGTGAINNVNCKSSTSNAIQAGNNSIENSTFISNGNVCVGFSSSTRAYNSYFYSNAEVIIIGAGNFYNCTLKTDIYYVTQGFTGQCIDCELINTFNSSIGRIAHEPSGASFINCNMIVANSSVVPIHSASTPTVYLYGNSVKGTTNFKSAGIVNGQTNTADAQGNVILN